ncbi:MAG: glycosyltransferase family 4 protein [Candidatus Omnitrophota bacterium]|jgi:glycosyltransferase involved in cell wall biosynthesis
MLAVIETHPIQYHAPVYRVLHQKFNIPLVAIYGSDCSVTGYFDEEFNEKFAWDTDLLSGYDSIFISQKSGYTEGKVDMKSLRKFREVFKKVCPAAALISGYWPHFNRRAIFESWQLGVPIFFRGDVTDHALKRNLVKSIARDAVLRFFYQHCQKLLYVGENAYKHYRRLGVRPENLVFSPHCVDTTSFQIDETNRYLLRSQIRLGLGVSDEDLVLIFSGKLSQRKGPDLILKAVKLLPTSLNKRITVIFLGNGDMKGQLEQLAASERSVKAVFVGFQNQSQLSKYYHAADLLILPSRYGETWGLVVNEALRHGVPCVVSDAVGCVPDLIAVGRTGEIFKLNSEADLARKIERAVHLTHHEEIREVCRMKVENYTVEKAAEGIATAYFSVKRPS